MVNNMEKVSQARIEEAKEMAWMTYHFWFLNTSLTPGMYSYFILGYDITLLVLSLKTNNSVRKQREKLLRQQNNNNNCYMYAGTCHCYRQNINKPEFKQPFLTCNLCPTIAQ